MKSAVKTGEEPLDLKERAFQIISGHRALDFLATLRDRHRQPTDCLCGPADLDRWLTAAGLSLAVRATRGDLDEARQLREAINRVARAALAGKAPATQDLRALNGWAARPALAPQADRGLRRRWSAECPVHSALALIAREAIELLTGPDRTLIRECAAAPSCSRLYLDRSPAGRRRWCSMDWCGSRAKMTSYRHRRATASRPGSQRS